MDKCKRDKYCERCAGTGTISLPQKIINPGVVDAVLRTKDCPSCTNGKQCAGGEPILVVTEGAEYEFHLERTACELCPSCHLELPPLEAN